MVNIINITPRMIKNYGFTTKSEAILFKKNNNIKSRKNETGVEFLTRMRDLKNQQLQEIENKKIDILFKQIKQNEKKLNKEKERINNKYNEIMKKININNNNKEEQYMKIINNLNNDIIKNASIKFNSNEDFLLFLNLLQLNNIQNLVINIDGVYKFLNYNSINKLKISLNQNIDDFYNPTSIKNLINSVVSISKYTPNPNFISKYTKKSGAFFPYLYKNIDHDFSKYQIFKTFDIKNYYHNCLYYALEQLKLSQDKLNHIKYIVKNRNINKSELTNVIKNIDICIHVHYYKKSGKQSINKYNTKSNNIYHIGLFFGHYFLYDILNITINKTVIKSSLQLFSFLINNKDTYLTNFTNDNFYNLTYTTDNITNLEYDEKYVIEYNELLKKQNEVIRKEESENNKIIYFDFETYVDISDNNKIKPYQVGFSGSNDEDFYMCINDNKNNLSSYNIADDMLERIIIHYPNYDNYILYAHNLKFDSCFFNFSKLSNINIISKDNNLYEMKFVYYFKKTPYNFICRDTLKHLAYKLSKLPEIFNLQGEFKNKEVIPYKLYTIDNINKKWINIGEAIENLYKYKLNCSETDLINFINNIKIWDCSQNKLNVNLYNDLIKQLYIKNNIKKNILNKIKSIDNNLNIIKYSEKYNRLDVLILKQAFNSWASQVREFTGLNVFNILTSASLAHKYMINRGVYKNLNCINGVAQQFIQKTVYGGRCMSNQNKKYLLRNMRIQDFDAVSLYPSGIYRMHELGGFLKGLPKILNEEQLNLNFLNSVDGYFIEIKIINKLKNLNFPLIPLRKDNQLIYNNELLYNEIIHVNRIQLEDLMNFNKMKEEDFKIIRGYYFNEGRDDTFCKIIKELFDKRVEYKKNKNPLQESVKLLLNSSYGKTIQHASESSIKILSDITYNNNNKYQQFINYNYNILKSSKKIDNVYGECNKYIVETHNNIINHFTYCHVGSEILSMSKRIMSEVMCLAEQNGIKIYYQDTDSMHIEEHNIPILEKLFKEKYNKDLIGSHMGQFHSDFSSNILKGDIYSSTCIILGKKAYLDILKTDDSNDVDYHCRMKGVSEDSINNFCKKHNMTLEAVFEGLYLGKKYSFDLTCENTVPKFKTNCFSTLDINNFDRQIRF